MSFRMVKLTENKWSETDIKFMREALSEAELALAENEVPVGCVIVDSRNDTIVARGHNQVNVSCNPTRHAELEAYDSLTLDQRQNQCQFFKLYVTCEPCGMCACALRYMGILKVVYGCANDRFGGCGTVTPSGIMPLQLIDRHDLKKSLGMIPDLKLENGLLNEEAVEILQQFYKQENSLAPPEKRKRKT